MGVRHILGEHSGVFFVNPYTSRVSYGEIKVILTSESVDEISVTIQMTPPARQQYFHVVLFIFKNILQIETWDSFWILILGTLGSERVKFTLIILLIVFLGLISRMSLEVPFVIQLLS